jgi:hypothetical protein
LAAAATELDQGVPDLLLSLVGTGNSFSFEVSQKQLNFQVIFIFVQIGSNAKPKLP